MSPLIQSENRGRQRPHPEGFTLIELLVVITIVSILGALLLPSLRSAKQRAAVAACSNNMRQTLIAIEVYRTDNEGTYPAVQEGPIDSGSKASNAYYFGRGGMGVDWVMKLGSNALSRASYRCAATLPEPSKGDKTGYLLSFPPIWVFSARHSLVPAGANSIPNKNRGWFLYFGPVPLWSGYSPGPFDASTADTACYDPWASAQWGVPFLSNSPGIGNTSGNSELSRNQQAIRPLLACPNVVFFPEPSAPNYTDAREPHMDQPYNTVTGLDALAWKVESRNWGYTDGHVQFYNNR